jgi:hypothetical protein
MSLNVASLSPVLDFVILLIQARLFSINHSDKLQIEVLMKLRNREGMIRALGTGSVVVVHIVKYNLQRTQKCCKPPWWTQQSKRTA